MFRLTMPVSALLITATPKVTFSYAKTKENLSKIFQSHNEKYMREKDNPDSEIMNFPQSFINTAYTLVQLFIAEFQKGKVRNGEMKMCKSYIKGHMVGAKLTIRTIDRHLERLKDSLTMPFISQKSRSTLGDIVAAGKDRNCISISFVEGVIASETTKENLVTPKIVDKSNEPSQTTIKLVNKIDDTPEFWGSEVAKILEKSNQNEAPNQ